MGDHPIHPLKGEATADMDGAETRITRHCRRPASSYVMIRIRIIRHDFRLPEPPSFSYLLPFHRTQTRLSLNQH
jgi:hypothetical protein